MTDVPQDMPRRDMLDSLVESQSNLSEPLTVLVDPSSDEGSGQQPDDRVDHTILNELTAKSDAVSTDSQKDQPSGQQDSSDDPTTHSDDTSANKNNE